MDCFIGASTGALKSVSLRDSSFTNLLPISSLNPKEHEITALAFTSPDQTELLVAQLDRHLQLYDTVTRNYSSVLRADAGEGKIKGLHVTPNNQIVTVCESGAVRTWDRENTETGACEVGAEVVCMDAAGSDGRLAVGGKQCPVRILDPATLQEQWRSRNVRHDSLCLEVPVWDLQTKFLRDDRTLVTTTGTHEIRIYDPRAQRRPVKRKEWNEEPITALGLSPKHEMNVFVANTKGEMIGFDLRTMRMNAKLKGQTGSIRSIHGHSSAPLVASVGIDRFLRVHDVNTRKIVHKVYLKARLNTVLMRENLSVLARVKEEEADAEDWAHMDKKDEDYSGKIVSDEDDDSDDENEDVWDILEKDDDVESVLENGEEDEESDEPRSKKCKIAPGKKGKDGVVKEKKRKESMGEHDEPEPVKRKKIVKLKRKNESAEKVALGKKKRT